MHSYILDIFFKLHYLLVLESSFYNYGNSVSPYCFPLPTVLLSTVFVKIIVIISRSVS